MLCRSSILACGFGVALPAALGVFAFLFANKQKAGSTSAQSLIAGRLIALLGLIVSGFVSAEDNHGDLFVRNIIHLLPAAEDTQSRG